MYKNPKDSISELSYTFPAISYNSLKVKYIERK